MEISKQGEEIVFAVNGLTKRVPGEEAGRPFVDVLRDDLYLRGTKFMCRQAVCGACTVTLSYNHPVTGNMVAAGVNSCLLPTAAVHGCSVTTIEGLREENKKPGKISRTLAAYSGTQCGFCSPGFVMSMHSLLQGNSGKVTSEQVENAFSGNICRCTGYRPIFDAFKSLSTDPPQSVLQITDIEDINCLGACTSCPEDCLEFSEIALVSKTPEFSTSSATWYIVKTVNEIFQIFDKIGNKKYMLVAGHTSPGIVEVKPSEVYIMINNVKELCKLSMEKGKLVIGSAVTITEAVNFMQTNAAKTGYSYLKDLASHWLRIASLSVRNKATIGGNLSVAYYNPTFPSDIMLTLETVNAFITIVSRSGVKEEVKPSKLLKMNLNKKIIKKITLKPLPTNVIFKSYKVMEVSQNVLATVGAGFLIELNSLKIVSKPTIVFSNITSYVMHASKTENAMEGKRLNSVKDLQAVIKMLNDELNPKATLPTSFSPTYRQQLALSLLYKTWLSLNGNNSRKDLITGGMDLVRPLSSGKQTYQTFKDEYPLTEPIPKISALQQTSGGAIYINDMLPTVQELSGCLVLASKLGNIKSIDPSKALKMPGVVTFLSAEDIPGVNNILTKIWFILIGIPEVKTVELFSSKRVGYINQPIGVILASTRNQAIKAAKSVNAFYTDERKPLITTYDVLKSGETDRVYLAYSLTPTKDPGPIWKSVTGEIQLGWQYAYPMETQTTLAVPLENDQFKMYSATQWPFLNIVAASQVTGLPYNKFDVEVTRLGGAFGVKLAGQLHTSTSAVLASMVTGRPVKIVDTLETDLAMVNKRSPILAKYTVGLDNNGVIQSLELDIYVNFGYTVISNYAFVVATSSMNSYDISRWKVNVYSVLSDTAPNVNLRAPGSFEGISIIEQIMDKVATVTGLDPIQIRMANSLDPVMTKYLQSWVDSTSYIERLKQIDLHNKENRWKKKGIAVSISKYGIPMAQRRIGASVSLLWPDATCLITTAGIEMGQGLNTKVAVVAAYELNIPLEQIQIKPMSTNQYPNAEATATSIGSDLAAYHTQKCCQILNERLKPIKEKMGPNATLKEIVNEALLNSGVNLTAVVPNGFNEQESELKDYFVYGVAVAETEIDVLTGERQILRVDILEDCGKSMSPLVDVGQIEGAFIFGMGALLSERIVYDEKAGRQLTVDAHTYKPPTSKDIPIDFRVTFVDNATNPLGVLNSKSTGEPATSLPVSIVNSLKYAITSARKDANLSLNYDTKCPLTIEEISLACGTPTEQLIV